MVNRRGASALGCLVPLLLFAAAGYVAVGFGEAYFRFYKFQDAMSQEARFADYRSEEVIQKRLVLVADSLGLPTGADQVTVTRTQGGIRINAEYDEVIKLPFKKEHVIHFSPVAQGRF